MATLPSVSSLEMPLALTPYVYLFACVRMFILPNSRIQFTQMVTKRPRTYPLVYLHLLVYSAWLLFCGALPTSGRALLRRRHLDSVPEVLPPTVPQTQLRLLNRSIPLLESDECSVIQCCQRHLKNRTNILIKCFINATISDLVEGSNIHWLNVVFKGCDLLLQYFSSHLKRQRVQVKTVSKHKKAMS